MSYIGKILSSSIERDKLKVIIEYTNLDDGSTFKDSIETNQSQDIYWADNAIKEKIKHLNSIKDMANKIEVDRIIDNQDIQKEEIDLKDERSIFKKDLSDFQKMINAISNGIMDRNNKDFIDLKEKLKKTFKTEYIDLF